MSTSYALPGGRCILPAPSSRGIIAARLNVERELTMQEQIESFMTIDPDAKALASDLAGLGFLTEDIGFGKVPAGCAIMKAGLRFWVFGDRIQFSACGEAVLATLAKAGHEIQREKIRVAYGMPVGWRPDSTMAEVAPNVYRGSVVDDLRVFAVPVMPRGGRWAIWMGVRAYRPSNGRTNQAPPAY